MRVRVRVGVGVGRMIEKAYVFSIILPTPYMKVGVGGIIEKT
jgi:hypothetical protein